MIMTDTEIAEIGAEPLTEPEHDAIKRYSERITGVPDCFDLVPDDGVGGFGGDDKVKTDQGLVRHARRLA